MDLSIKSTIIIIIIVGLIMTFALLAPIGKYRARTSYGKYLVSGPNLVMN